MMTKYIFGILILFGFIGSTTIVVGQERKVAVSGFVKVADSREVMSGATIIISGQGASSNNNGFYSIRIGMGRHILECHFMGFEPFKREINISSDTVVNIEMKENTISINDVVVVGNVMIPVASKFGRVSVNMQQLKHMPLFMGEQDIFKYFQMIPGISGGREGSSSLNIRGGSSDQTLIILDDVPIYNQNHALGFISIFNGDALNSAELYKGGIPATMGGRLSGVTSITTRSGNRSEHRQYLGIGTLTTSLLAEGPINNGRGAYMVSGRYFMPYLYLSAIYPLIKQNSRISYMFYDITGKISYDLNDKNTLSWSIYTGRDAMIQRVIEKGGVNEWSSEPIPASLSKLSFSWSVIAGSLKLNSVLNNGGFMNTTIYYSGLRNIFSTDFESKSEDQKIITQLKSTIDEFGLTSIAERKLGNTEVKYGVSATLQNVLPKDYYMRLNTEKESAFVSERMNLYTGTVFVDNVSSAGKWGFHYGLRVPVYYNGSKTAFNFEPRLGMSYDWTESSSFFLSFDRNTQPLFSLNKQYYGFPIDFWFPYREEQIQLSNQISGSWKYKPNEQLLFSIEGFYKEMGNLVFVTNEDAMLSDRGGYKLGIGSAYGGEFILQYTTQKTSIIASYAQTKSQRKVDEDVFDFMFDIPLNINLFGKYEVLNRNNERIHNASININYHSGLPHIISQEIFPVMNENPRTPEYLETMPNNPIYPNTRLADYFRVDLNYTMEKKLDNGKRVWQISFLNATAHMNPYMVFMEDHKYKAIYLIPFLPSLSYKRFW
jgi:Outer membrane receptor proteins, mostly Fe transport